MPTAIIKAQTAQILAQRHGVRVVGFRKCGHTSIINTFCTLRSEFEATETAPSTPWSKEPGDNSTRPAILNTTDRTQRAEAYRGYLDTAENWPEPHTVVGFIRDPVRRALSAYQHFIIRTSKLADGARTVGRESFHCMGFTPDMDFAQYCEHLGKIDPSNDPHIEPYYDRMPATGTENSRFLLAPLELISEVWPAFVEDLGLDDVPLGVWRQNRGGYKPDKYLTDEVVDQVRTIYSADYRLWQTIYDETRETLPAVRYKTFDELVSLVNQ
jgi:hypothetical protein